jgi:hypothetical protein
VGRGGGAAGFPQADRLTAADVERGAAIAVVAIVECYETALLSPREAMASRRWTWAISIDAVPGKRRGWQ